MSKIFINNDNNTCHFDIILVNVIQLYHEPSVYAWQNPDAAALYRKTAVSETLNMYQEFQSNSVDFGRCDDEDRDLTQGYLKEFMNEESEQQGVNNKSEGS